MASFTRGIRWPGLAHPDIPTPLIVERIEKTCDAVPAQWEGITADGDWIYFRYRWGRFSIALWSDESGADWTDIYWAQIGDDLDGSMGYAKLRKTVPPWVTLPETEERDAT